MKKTLLAALAVLALAGLSACNRSDPVFGAKVRAYLLEHPEVLVEAQTALEEKQLQAAIAKTRAQIPTYRAQIERDPRDFVANPSGAITVTEFFDYRCPACKAAAPEIMKLIAANPDVRFVFKDFPILSVESQRAAATALVVKDQGKYLDVANPMFASPKLDEASIDKIVSQAGLDPAEVKTRSLSTDIQRRLVDTHALASAMGINATPTFIIGDTVIAGADLPAIKAAIAEERKKAG